MKKYCLLFLLLAFHLLTASAQDDLLQSLNTDEPKEKVLGTFNSTRVVNQHSVETAGRNVLEFRITHRFGNVGSGEHGLWGLDNSSDIHIGFDYGISNRWQVGLGRSKINQLYDFFTKYRVLHQTTGGMPVSLTVFGNVAINSQKQSRFAEGEQTFSQFPDFNSRLSYCTQIIVARKFSKRFSLQANATLLHRNYVGSNPTTDYYLSEPTASSNFREPRWNENTYWTLGGAAKFRVSRLLTLTGDYSYVFNQYFDQKPDNQIQYHMPIGFGTELEVGGHIFMINATNAEAVLPNNFLVNSPQSWFEGGWKLGFTIVRIFTPGHRIVKSKAPADGSMPEEKPTNGERKRKKSRVDMNERN
jgi:hypothetical protein